MAKTYLEIINIGLLDANEVTLTATTFLSARGIQAFAKEAVNRALMDMANESTEWEWLKDDTVLTPSTVSTIDGDQWYAFGATVPAEVDFDTFYLTDSLGGSQPLQRITYAEWDLMFRQGDAPADSKARPIHIIETDEKNQFGLSPVPDDIYTIDFNSWRLATFLAASTDVIPFPDQFYNVLVARVRYYLWDFKDDQKKASRAGKEYELAIAKMRARRTTPEFTRARSI